MFKVGIVTINDPSGNYGNRLQNYAVVYVLTNMRYNPVTLYVEKQFGIKSRIKMMIHERTGYRFAKEKDISRYKYHRRKKFKHFNYTYLDMKYIRCFRGLSKKYDFFVTGSDQVWNPNWYTGRKAQAYLLKFAKDKQKKTFSPSFGIDRLPEQWQGEFKKALKSFKNLSVREETGADIIYELTGKTAEVLIDPTLMLDVAAWRKIEREPENIDTDSPYILTYFLGGRSEETEKYIQNLAKEKGMKVYNLLDTNMPDLFMTGPSEFLYLLDKSQMIMTDSFHACALSFVFCKPFVVFERQGKEQNMMSRMNTFLKKFGFENRLYGAGTDDELWETDYDDAFRKLAEEKLKVVKYIRRDIEGVV